MSTSRADGQNVGNHLAGNDLRLPYEIFARNGTSSAWGCVPFSSSAMEAFQNNGVCHASTNQEAPAANQNRGANYRDGSQSQRKHGPHWRFGPAGSARGSR